LASEAAEVREAIEETRAQLGATVQALAEKADVKAQVSKKVERAKENTVALAQGVVHTASGVPVKASSNRKVAVPLLFAVVGVAFVLLRRHNAHSEGTAVT
jgi:uncharacterized protein (UPF0548 family)